MAPELVRALNEKEDKYLQLVNHADALKTGKHKRRKTVFKVAALNHTGEMSHGMTETIEFLSTEYYHVTKLKARKDGISPKQASAKFRSNLVDSVMIALFRGWGHQLLAAGYSRADDLGEVDH